MLLMDHKKSTFEILWKENLRKWCYCNCFEIIAQETANAPILRSILFATILYVKNQAKFMDLPILLCNYYEGYNLLYKVFNSILLSIDCLL